MNDDRPPVRCARCSKPLAPGRGDHYLVGIVAVADPSPPVVTEEDLARDLSREIRILLDRLRGTSEAEAMDQVVRRKVFRLCNACYKGWIESPTGADQAGSRFEE
jgi:hypothetical protein